jgi:predicted nucleic acid-binding protein
MKKVLLDTNIVLDFALKREAFYESAQAIFCEAAGRQWNNVDVRAVVNNRYLIVAEDKTNTAKPA